MPEADALLAKLAALTQPKADVPEGYYPIDYWVERFGKDSSDCYSLLNQGVKAGVMKSGRFRPADGARKLKHWKEL